MKILVISDTHSCIDYAIGALEKEKCDWCIHLGDMVRDCEDLESIFPRQKFIFVKGNNDFWVNSSMFPDERFFELGGKKFFICHGHKYGVKSSPEFLKAHAKSLGADICLFGHTHQKFLDDTCSPLMLNPGSKGNYGIIIIENGDIYAELKTEIS